MTDEEIEERRARLVKRLVRVYAAIAILFLTLFTFDFLVGDVRASAWTYAVQFVLFVATASTMLVAVWSIWVTDTVVRWHSSRNWRERRARERDERAIRTRVGLAPVREALARFMAGEDLQPLWRLIMAARRRDDLAAQDREWLDEVYGLAYMAQSGTPTPKERSAGLIGPHDLRREIRSRSLG